MYESDVAEKVQDTFEECRETQNYKEAILSTANDLQLSKASVTSYLPYQKGVYFPSTAEKEKISVGAERQRSCRAMKRWKDDLTEENLWWKCIVYDGNKMNSWSAKKPSLCVIHSGGVGQILCMVFHSLRNAAW